jgi:CheY-like chemotaxis protein
VVITGSSDLEALSALAAHDRPPDLIISDYHLSAGKTGVEAIERLRSTFNGPIPAILISGDTDPKRLGEAHDSGHSLLRKPVDAMRLRAVLNQLLKKSEALGSAPGLESARLRTIPG